MPDSRTTLRWAVAAPAAPAPGPEPTPTPVLKTKVFRWAVAAAAAPDPNPLPAPGPVLKTKVFRWAVADAAPPNVTPPADTLESRTTFRWTVAGPPPPPSAPVNTTPPSISAWFYEPGQTATVDPGAWDYAVSFAYVWKVNGVEVLTTADPTITLAVEYIGTLTVDVEATNGAGTVTATTPAVQVTEAQDKETREITDGPPNYVGLLSFQVRNTDTNTIVVPETTLGIIETPPASGRYVATFVKPTPGRYEIVWLADGSAVGSELFSVAMAAAASYASLEDLDAYSAARMLNVGDYAINEKAAALLQAERDVKLKMKYELDDDLLGLLDPTTRQALRDATCAQATFRLHMGPVYFLEGGIDPTAPTPTRGRLFSAEAMEELFRVNLMSRTGRMSSDRPRLQSSQRRF